MITAIVPSYNHKNYIAGCISELAKLPESSTRIIIIDDESTDGSAEAIRRLINESGLNNVELIEKKNSGLVDSLNIGLQLATSEFFYLVASDDTPSADGIIECLEELKKTPNANFCIGGGLNVFESGESSTKVYSQPHDEFFAKTKKQREVDVFLNYPSPVLLQSTIFRTSYLKEIGGWDKSLKLDDYQIFAKSLSVLEESGIDFLFSPNIHVVSYRHHSKNTYLNYEKLFLMRSDVIKSLAPKSIQGEAIGKIFAYYSIKSLSKGSISPSFRMLSKCSPGAIIGASKYILTTIIKRLLKNKI